MKSKSEIKKCYSFIRIKFRTSVASVMGVIPLCALTPGELRRRRRREFQSLHRKTNQTAGWLALGHFVFLDKGENKVCLIWHIIMQLVKLDPYS